MSTCETCSGKGYIDTTGHPSLPFGKMYIERCDERFHAGRTTLTDEQAAVVNDRRKKKKKRLSKVCRGLGITSPEGIRILSLYGRKIVRRPNTKLTRLERAVLTLHTTLFK